MKKYLHPINTFWEALIDPRKLFLELCSTPKNLFPLILVLFTGFLLAFSTSKFTIEEITYIFGLEENVSNSAIILGSLTFLISGGLLVEWLVQSIVIYFIVAVFSSENRPFRVVSSIIGYSWIPITIKVTFFSLLVLISGELYEPNGFAGLMNNTNNQFLIYFFKNLDLFVIWKYVIMYIGIRVLLRGLSKWLTLVLIISVFLFANILKLLPQILEMIL